MNQQQYKFELVMAKEPYYIVELNFKQFLDDFFESRNLIKSVTGNLEIIENKIKANNGLINKTVCTMVDWGLILKKIDPNRKKITFRLFKVKYTEMPFIVPGVVDGMATRMKIDFREGKEIMMLHDYFIGPENCLNFFFYSTVYDFTEHEWKIMIDWSKDET